MLFKISQAVFDQFQYTETDLVLQWTNSSWYFCLLPKKSYVFFVKPRYTSYKWVDNTVCIYKWVDNTASDYDQNPREQNETYNFLCCLRTGAQILLIKMKQARMIGFGCCWAEAAPSHSLQYKAGMRCA